MALLFHRFFQVIVILSVLSSTALANESVTISGSPFNAHLNNPWGIWKDVNTGNLYISEPLTHRVLVADSSNSLTIFAGTGDEGFLGDNDLATNAKLSTPKGIWGDSEQLFICDTTNNRLRAVNFKSNLITTVAGGGFAVPTATSQTLLATDAFLMLPRGVWGNGKDIYLSDSSKIYHISWNGLIQLFAGGGVDYGWNGAVPATRLQLNNPNFIVGDGAGNIFVSDSGNTVIRKITSADGTSTVYAGALRVHSAGPFNDGKIANQVHLASPAGLWIDNQQNLVFADSGLAIIGKIDGKDATIQRIAGSFGWTGGADRDDTGDNYGDGGFGSQASFNNPLGLWGDDNSGSIYIADLMHSSVRVAQYLATPSPTAAPTSTPSGPAIFGFQWSIETKYPYAIWQADDGALFMTDNTLHVIYRVQPDMSAVEIFAGSSGVAGYQDDTSLQAKFNTPLGIWGLGQMIYICDSLNNVVRSLDVNTGTVSTFLGGGSNDPSTVAPNTLLLRDAALQGAFNIWGSSDGARMYVSTNHGILFVSGGVVSSQSDLSNVNAVKYFAFDSQGNLYYPDVGLRAIRKIAPSGPSIFAGANAVIDTFPDGTDCSNIALQHPTGLWVDPTDTYLYFSDSITQIVGRIELATGRTYRYAGNFYLDGGPGKDQGDSQFGDGDLAVNARLNGPTALWGNQAGDLFIIDYGHSAMREVSFNKPTNQAIALPLSFFPASLRPSPNGPSTRQLRGQTSSN